jgi:hypothetical protein
MPFGFKGVGFKGIRFGGLTSPPTSRPMRASRVRPETLSLPLRGRILRSSGRGRFVDGAKAAMAGGRRREGARACLRERKKRVKGLEGFSISV